MAESIDMIVPLLREMRAEMHSGFDRTIAKLGSVERRLSAIEETLVSFRQALTAASRLSKPVTGGFEELTEVLAKKFKDLETTR